MIIEQTLIMVILSYLTRYYKFENKIIVATTYPENNDSSIHNIYYIYPFFLRLFPELRRTARNLMHIANGKL